MFVTVIGKIIVVTSGAVLNHLVRNILDSEFIVIYTIIDKLRWLEAISNAVDSLKLKLFKRFMYKYQLSLLNTDGFL